MLSNRAVPKYYGEFRRKVLRGEIPVNEKVSLEMNRIDALIESPRYYYDGDKVEGWIEFCETELTLTDGSDLHMLDSFKLWGEQVLGWYYFIERSVYVPSTGRYETRKILKRLINKQYLIVGRGAAKTLYNACHHGYGVFVDQDTTDQIAVAPTMMQAEETINPLRTALARAKGPVFQLFTMGSIHNTNGNQVDRQKFASTKKGIENFLTNSIVRVLPMSKDKLQGQRCKYATIDEVFSVDIREDVENAIQQSASKIDDWLIIVTSSEGTVRNGPGDTKKMELDKILNGEYINEHVSIWWYRLDDINEVADPSMWLKANPNLGITVTYETYQQEVEQAENSPATRNDTLAKRFGIPSEGLTYFFTYEETLCSRRREFWKMPCALGADLSRGDDFCAFTFLFPLPRGGFGVKARSYITSVSLNKLHPAMREKYEDFIQEGSLIVMDDTVLNMMDVYDDLDQYILDSEYDVVVFGYDPYNAQSFVERWVTENGAFGVEKVKQGARTESVPLGELKTYAEEGMLQFDQEIMSFCMGNAITLEDTNGNRKLWKDRRDKKIDNVAAMIDAYVAIQRNPDAFE